MSSVKNILGASTTSSNWWDAYPEVKSSPPNITAEEVAALIRDPGKTQKDFAIIDVRRDDHAGGHVRGSHNWAAQTFHDNLANFYSIFGPTKQVIFCCGSCHSTSRGARTAGWYQDYLDSVHGSTHSSAAYILEGGAKGWLAKFSGEADLVDKD